MRRLWTWAATISACTFSTYTFSACGTGEAAHDEPSVPAPSDAGTSSSTRGDASTDGGAPTPSEGIDAGPSPGTGAKPSPGCAAPKSSVTDGATLTLKHDGIDRSFILKIGHSIDPTKPVPLWIDWHGLGSNAQQEKSYSGSAQMADKRGFVVAYPQGLGAAFNGGVCCSLLGAPPHEADDVGFGRAIVEMLGGAMCLDLRRVYSLGMSNGGYMSEYDACMAADLYASVASVSALGVTQTSCTPSRPIPMIAFNGTDDHNVPYSGSRDSLKAWRTRDQCTGDPARVDYGKSYCETWACRQGTELTSCTVTGMNHCWPGNTLVIPTFCQSGGLTDIDATTMIADFFDRFPLPN